MGCSLSTGRKRVAEAGLKDVVLRQYTWLVGGEGGLKGLKAPLPSDFLQVPGCRSAGTSASKNQHSMAGPSMQDPAQAPERSEANATAALASSAIGSEPMRRVRRKKGVRGGAISTGGPRGGAWVGEHRRERNEKVEKGRARPWKKVGAGGGLYRCQTGLMTVMSRPTDAASGSLSPEQTTPDPNGRGHARMGRAPGRNGASAARRARSGQLNANRNYTVLVGLTPRNVWDQTKWDQM
ncbi:uncharacterized protein BDCG_01282 [Blastomyces dermatitidis ER-3]|uniref:Uncharacterized protein n=1 Tax=Ajellomyces dermatitidis (strain ER-3 / ATCC MYA-2586) TaxID=559297 RepID=A0ABP2EQ72_AJEDR|nr:uncharacterized protein BDCG_01282 [Blastomyces dermatitidis ER-3]EEQ84476.2 hypothetical protein BDCG_01282 [Blastomyces dermatitidis ER-3]